MKPQYPHAQWIPHTHYWPGRSRHSIKYIILHAVAGIPSSAAQTAKAYQSSSQKAGGPHYIVGRFGEVIQCVNEQDAAWSNGTISAGAADWWGGKRGNPNLETVSVEFVKVRGDHSDAITPAQQDSGFRLIAYLQRKYGIPARWADASGGITGHFSMDPVHARNDPGPFPWDELFHQLIAPAEKRISPLLLSDAPALLISNRPPAQAYAAKGNTGSGEAQSNANTPTTVGGRAHQALQEAPGFLGVIQATDTAESFQSLKVGGLADIPNWLASNGLALAVRLALIGLGVALVLALMWSLVRRNSWMGKAGGDLIPLALGDASATGNFGKESPNAAA